jgi:hypothetical protein
MPRSDDMRGQQVLSDPQGWRELIQARVRPRVEEMMARANWWSRFQRVVGM